MQFLNTQSFIINSNPIQSFKTSKQYLIQKLLLMQKQIEDQVKRFMMPFIEISNLSNTQFPIFPTTYTLWRKVCYKNIRQNRKIQKDSPQQKIFKRTFFQVSERSLLQLFINKIKNQMDGRSIGWKKAILEQDELKKADLQEYRQLLMQYSQSLYLQQLYIEMFYDMVSIPYSEIYSQSKTYQTNHKFRANFYKKKNQTFVDKVCNKFGKSVISKGLGKISEAALSKWMVYGMTGIIGGLNPLAIAASFSVNYALDTHQKYSKLKQITTELQFLKFQTQKNVKQLKQTYERCICSIQAMLYLDQRQAQTLQRQKSKFYQQILSKILIEDWLQIKIHRQGQWEIVQLNDKYAQSSDIFQDIDLIESEK